jgi:hypothetical protein
MSLENFAQNFAISTSPTFVHKLQAEVREPESEIERNQQYIIKGIQGKQMHKLKISI